MNAAIVRGIAGCVFVICIPLLTYIAMLSPIHHGLCAAITFALLLLLLGIWTWRLVRYRGMILLLLALFAGLLYDQPAWLGTWPINFRTAYLLQHAGMLAVLAILFGRSLLPGQKPMISRFAEAAHGGLSARLIVYTRQVTFAWTMFFGAMTVSSLVIFFDSRFVQWSVITSFLTIPLVAAMFAGEYLVRMRVIPAAERSAPMAAIKACWRYSAFQRAPRQPVRDVRYGDQR